MGRLTQRARAIVTSGASRILTGSLVGQGVLLAVSPLLTRLYTPQDFGALAAFTALATVLGGLTTLSWERAIVIPRADANSKSLAILAIGSSLFMSGVVAGAALVGGPWLDNILGTTVLETLWWLLPLTTFTMGIYSIVSSLLVRQRAYGDLAIRNAVQGFSQAVSSVLLGVTGAGPIGLLSGIFVGRLASSLGVAWRVRRGRVSATRSRVRVVARRFRRFPLVLTWSRVLNSLGLQLPPLIVIAIYGSFEAGLYALTVRVLATPIGIVVDAVSQQFEGSFASRVRARAGGLSRLIQRVVGQLFVIGIFPTLVIVFFAPTLFAWVFGSEWTVAGQYAQVAIGCYLLQFAVSPISRCLIVLERQGTQLTWDVSRMVVTALAVFLPGYFGYSLFGALIVLSISQAVLYVVLFVISARVAADVEKAVAGAR